MTEHGHPVARLTPNPAPRRSRMEQLIAEGRVIPATRDLLDFEPLDLGPGRSLTEILLEMRDEEEF